MDVNQTQTKEKAHSCSPPEWVKRANLRDAPIVLEHRLEHFIGWLEQKGVGFSPDTGARLPRSKVIALIEEYVNT